jgi:hypothetical protein
MLGVRMFDSVVLGRLVLAKVIDRLGGLTAVASRLDIDPALLKLYVDGDRPIPDAVLLCAADLVLEDLPTLTRQASEYFAASRPD